MSSKPESGSNFAPLKIVLPFVLIAQISAGGIEIWPVYIFVLALVVLMYHRALRPAGAFARYQLHDDTIEVTNILTKQKKSYALQGEVYFYLYPSLIPHLLISDTQILSKREAKAKIKHKDVGCVTLWGEFRSTLSAYEKKAVRLK